MKRKEQRRSSKRREEKRQGARRKKMLNKESAREECRCAEERSPVVLRRGAPSRKRAEEICRAGGGKAHRRVIGEERRHARERRTAAEALAYWQAHPERKWWRKKIYRRGNSQADIICIYSCRPLERSRSWSCEEAIRGQATHRIVRKRSSERAATVAVRIELLWEWASVRKRFQKERNTMPLRISAEMRAERGRSQITAEAFRQGEDKESAKFRGQLASARHKNACERTRGVGKMFWRTSVSTCRANL
ncbi:hypothetical protein B0H14DRAFT_3671761 [Mycena olivaceomarginata]|nr:hypothetical protein B0H14DRAFT_3671761 [Mycena olivaceomarginata]